MTTEIIPITSREQWLAARKQDITASASGALLGVHEYLTAFELWGLKTGRIQEEEENIAMRRGRLLEPVAAQILAEDNPDWKCWNPKHYLRDAETRMGATPDLYVDCPVRGPGIIQIKTTADLIFRDKWKDKNTGEIVLPLWIAVQAMQEQHLSGRNWAQVALLICGMGLDLYQVDVPMKPAVLGRVTEEIAKFWDMIKAGTPMPPDYARDGEALAKVYNRGDEPDIDLTGDEEFSSLIVLRDSLKARIDDATGNLDEVKTRVKARLGNAAIARCGSRMVTWKVVNKREYIVPASSNRTLLFK